MAKTAKPVRKLIKKSHEISRKFEKETKPVTKSSASYKQATKSIRKREDKKYIKSLKPEYKKSFGESKEKTAKNLKKISL